MKKEILTSNAPAAIGPYSQAVIAGGFLFASGQIPVNPADGSVPEGVRAQTVQALENVKAVLETAGLTFSDVVKTTVFIKNMTDFAVVNEVYGSYFTKPYPARSCVEVAALPKGVLVEIETISVVKE